MSDSFCRGNESDVKVKKRGLWASCRYIKKRASPAGRS